MHAKTSHSNTETRLKVAEKLLLAGADVTIINSEGVSALQGVRSPELLDVLAKSPSTSFSLLKFIFTRR